MLCLADYQHNFARTFVNTWAFGLGQRCFESLMHIRRTLARAVHFMGRVPHCFRYTLWMFGLDRMPGSDLLNSTQLTQSFSDPVISDLPGVFHPT